MQPIFITGTGTDVGKTIAAVVIANALNADYWKPIQAGNSGTTDKETVRSLMHYGGHCFDEVYNLKLAASPHIAARDENITINLHKIVDHFQLLQANAPQSKYLVIEGAGGLLVPLNDDVFVIDLIQKLKAKVILVSRNYLGSINHSLLTAQVCKQHNIDVLGWLFNDEYLDYQQDIECWSGYPIIGKIGKLEQITKKALHQEALLLKDQLLRILESNQI